MHRKYKGIATFKVIKKEHPRSLQFTFFASSLENAIEKTKELTKFEGWNQNLFQFRAFLAEV